MWSTTMSARRNGSRPKPTAASPTGKWPATSSGSDRRSFGKNLMLTDQTRAPIVEALAEFKAEGAISFGVPGHKSGKGAPDDMTTPRSCSTSATSGLPAKAEDWLIMNRNLSLGLSDDRHLL